MKIELRKVSHSARLSHETEAFAADIYVDGVKRGTAENDGNGGSNMICPHTLEMEINAYAKTLPEAELGYGLGKVAQNADMLISDLLFHHLALKDMTRKMKRAVLFVPANGKLYSAKVAPKDAVHVLNTMPIDDGLALYRSAGSK